MREGIAVGGAQRTPHFKSTLMIGAAGLAVAGVSTASAAAAAAGGSTPPADAPKWLPYASVGGQVGDGISGANVDLFVPVWQDLNSLLFVRLGVGTQTRDDEIANFGLGYRTKVDPSWILGVYGGLDASHTKYGHTFTQGAVGAELMSADWDLRINGYLATQSEAKDIANKYALYIHDTRIAVMQGQEGAYSGFDGEVGYRVFSTDDADFRVFAGGFSFSRDPARATSTGQTFTTDFRDIQGPYGRAEVDLYDIDALGTQSRITVTGQISHDDVRGTSGYVGASLRIPLGAGWGQGGQALDELDRRMVDQVRRQDNVLTQWQYSKPEPVIIYNGTVTSEPTNTLYYVDNTVGAGTYADPTTPQDATSRISTNAFIVATAFDGPIVATGTTLQSGQRLVSPGTFKVRGVDSGHVFSHDFAPGSGAPTFTAASATDNIITLANNSVVSGITFSGPFNAAIYGSNITSAEISNVTIDASAGNYGVLINQTQSQDMSLHISNSTITGAGTDGVAVNSTVSDGGTSNQTIELTNSTISGSGMADVALTTSVSGGSTVNQSILVDPTVLSGGEYGFLLDAYVDGGTLNQDITLSDVTFTGQTYGGIAISGTATNGGTLDQTITLDNVTANGALYGSDIGVRADAYYGGSVTQHGTWSNVTANDAYDNGVAFHAYAADGGTAIQNFGITGLTATGNYYDGLRINGAAFDNAGLYGPSVVAQYFTIADSTLTGNDRGLSATTIAFGGYAATLQDVAVTNSTLSGNLVGLYGEAGAIYNASAQQIVTLYGDTVGSNLHDGAEFTAIGYFGGFAAQTINVYNSSFSNNGQDGMALLAGGLSGGNAEQNANIYYSAFDGNGRDGLNIRTISGGYALGYYAYYGQVTQNVFAAYDSFSNNGRDGVHIDNKVYAGGQLNQFLYFYGDTIDHNAGYGIYETTYANAYGPPSPVTTNAYSDLYVVNSTADHNGISGIYVYSYALGPGYTIQHVDILGTDASYNGYDGFTDHAAAVGYYSLNIQYVTLSGSAFDSNGDLGAGFVAYQNYGPNSFGAAIQDVTISGSDFSGNGNFGLAAEAEATGFQGRAEQNFNISGSRFDYNGVNGIRLVRNAHDGYYVTGYGCDTVQGLTGGCAFVRQEVSIVGSDISYNGLTTYGDGIYIKSIADNYGAIYDVGGRPGDPTLFIADTTVNGNGGDGLSLHNEISNNSYLFQYVVIRDSQFDGNYYNGVLGVSYVSGASTMMQRAVLYSYAGTVEASHNGYSGVYMATSVTDAGTHASSYIIAQGGDFSYDSGAGGIGQFVRTDSLGAQSVGGIAAYSNTLSHNDYSGVFTQTSGTYAADYNHIGGNVIANNLYGLWGEAFSGSYQYWDTTLGNTFTANGTDVHLVASGGTINTNP